MKHIELKFILALFAIGAVTTVLVFIGIRKDSETLYLQTENRFDRDNMLSETGVAEGESTASEKPKNAIVYYIKGNTAADAKDFEKAIEYYDKAIFLEPTHGPAYFYKGIALLKLEKKKEAIVCINRSVSLEPTLAQKALVIYDTVLAAEPTFAEAQYGKGNALLKMGNWAEARKYFESARALGYKP